MHTLLTYNDFEWADNPPKMPFSLGNQHPMIYMAQWTHISQPNGIGSGSAIFAGLTNATNRETDTHTLSDHATPSVAIIRILCNA